jgi:hypothetical protein
MREQLIRMDDIPPTGTVTVDLLGREVLVMILNGSHGPTSTSACTTGAR